MIAALQTFTFVVYMVGGLLLIAAAVLSILRMEPGPGMLNRIIALDVFTAILICAAGLLAASTGRGDIVPVLLALALTGFFGAVAMARFKTTDNSVDRRILTREELEAELAARAEREADDDAPAVHDPEEESEDELLEQIEQRRSAHMAPPREGSVGSFDLDSAASEGER